MSQRVQRVAGRQRLGPEHVERGAGELAGLQRRGQGVVVDAGAAGRVDEVGRGLHGLQLGLADDAPASRR